MRHGTPTQESGKALKSAWVIQQYDEEAGGGNRQCIPGSRATRSPNPEETEVLIGEPYRRPIIRKFDKGLRATGRKKPTDFQMLDPLSKCGYDPGRFVTQNHRCCISQNFSTEERNTQSHADRQKLFCSPFTTKSPMDPFCLQFKRNVIHPMMFHYASAV